ncbi:MAG: HAD-IIIA family hydrolase, partial [Proteobacteria bacterium]
MMNNSPSIQKLGKEIAGYGDQPCLFLDRDGVVIPDIPYNTDVRKITLTAGIVDLIARAHKEGYWVVLVTNQSGLGRGLFGWNEYREVHQKVCALLAEAGQWLDLSVCAPYYEGTEFIEAQSRPHFRKPDVGMFEHARRELGIAYARSIMVGDSATDLIPAYKLGIKKL